MSTTAQSNTAAKREAWGRLRKLPSGGWRVRYPGPDGTTYTARTDQDRPLTFLTKTDARTWLAGVQSKMARGLWEPSEETAARLEAELAIEQAQSLGFEEYSARWLEMIRTEPNRSGKKRAVGTVRSCQGKVTGYLVPEFGSTPVREIDADTDPPSNQRCIYVWNFAPRNATRSTCCGVKPLFCLGDQSRSMVEFIGGR